MQSSIKVDEEDLYTLKINCKAKRTVGKANKARQAHRGAPLTRVLLCSSAHQSLKGVPWVGSCSVVRYISHLKEHLGRVLLCIRRLMGQPLLFSCRCWRCKEREVMEMAPPAMRDSSIALLPWLPGFPPWAFRTTVSSLTSP